LSQVTNIRSLASTETPKPKSKGLALAAGGLGLLLVGGIVAGGLYVARPDMFGSTPAATETLPQAETKSEIPSTASSLVEGQSAAVANTNTSPAADATVDKPKAVDSPTKTADTAKTAQQTPRPDPSNDGEIVVSSLDEDGRPVTVKRSPDGRTTTYITPDGTLTMRDGTVIQRRPPPPKPGNPQPQFPNGIDPKRLTPEQRRKLRILMNDPNFKPPPEFPKKPTN
jgi:hypothetical protein